MATPIKYEGKGLGTAGTLVLVGGGAFVLWKGFQLIQDYFSRKRTEASQQNIIKSTLSIEKTKGKISDIERSSYVSGVNSYGKKVTVNLVNQVKEVINAYFITVVDKNGLSKYYPKGEPNQAAIVNAVFTVPVKHLKHFAKIYSIYTGRDFLNDMQKLSPLNYQKIKAVFTVSFKKYGA